MARRSKKKLQKMRVAFILATAAIVGISPLVYKYVESRGSDVNASTIYYVSKSGNDSYTGTSSQPFLTISKAASIANPGDTVLIMGGTYNEKVTVSRSGTSGNPITFKNYDSTPVIVDAQYNSTRDKVFNIAANYIELNGLVIKNSPNICVISRGSYNVFRNLDISGCTSHGLDMGGAYNEAHNVTVYNSVLSNKLKDQSSWGSGLKVSVNGNNVVIKDSKAYNNYGEGIAITRGVNVSLTNSTFFDNYSANIYVDNSKDVLVDNNFSYSTGNTQYFKDGRSAGGIVMAEEYYSGWGAQLARVTITNNVVLNTHRGFMYWGADPEVASAAGMDTIKISHNTFWGIISSKIYIAEATAKTRNTVISNNIFGGTGTAWIDNPAGMTFRNNLWNALPSSDSGARGTGDQVETMPFSITPVITLKNSVALKPGSLAIDRGYNEGVLKDAFMTSRPQGGAADIGAYEVPSTGTSYQLEEVRVMPSEDVFVRSNYPTRNYGKNTKLITDYSPFIYSYMKFDLTSLSSKTIDSAKLRIYVNDGAQGIVQSIYKNTPANWSEASTTYNSRPSNGPLVTTFTATGSGVWVEVDLKDFVTTNKGSLVGMTFSSASTNSFGFNSREATSNKPYLVINVQK